MWVKLCERIGSHPKLLAVGAEAAWLWVCSIAYANAHVTNGVLPKRALRAFFPTDDWTGAKVRGLADRLVEAGLWEENSGDSWQIHDYAVYQAEAMSERVERKREWDRNRQAVNRATKKGKHNSRVINDLHHLSQRDTGGQLVDSRVDGVRGRPVDVSTPVTVVSRGTDPIRSEPRIPQRAHPRARAHTLARSATPSDPGAGPRNPPPEPIGQESPNGAPYEPEGPDAQTEAPQAPEGHATAHGAAPSSEPEGAPTIFEPVAEAPQAHAAPVSQAAAIRPASFGYVVEGSEVFDAYFAEHWANVESARGVATSGQLGEYVAEKWRERSEGGFQSGASSTLLVGLGRTMADLKVTPAEAAEIAEMLKNPKDHFGRWATDVHAGRPVVVSFLLGRALANGTYEARQFSELVSGARARIEKRKAKRAAAAVPADRPATVTAKPATAEEVREIGRPLIERLRAQKAVRDAEEADRKAAFEESQRRSIEYWAEHARRHGGMAAEG